MQHKGLTHAWEILLPILEMPLIHNITQPLMVVFIGSVPNFLQAFQIKKKSKMRTLFKVCGKTNLKGT